MAAARSWGGRGHSRYFRHELAVNASSQPVQRLIPVPGGRTTQSDNHRTTEPTGIGGPTLEASTKAERRASANSALVAIPQAGLVSDPGSCADWRTCPQGFGRLNPATAGPGTSSACDRNFGREGRERSMNRLHSAHLRGRKVTHASIAPSGGNARQGFCAWCRGDHMAMQTSEVTPVRGPTLVRPAASGWPTEAGEASPPAAVLASC
jgi:hypothetical protein